jgi:hypothetical protein
LSRLIVSCYGFKRKGVDENYLKNKLGLSYKKFIVLEQDFELAIFYPKGGGAEAVIKAVTVPSQILQWIEKGVSRIGIAIDLDDKDVQNLTDSIEKRLENKYGHGNVTKIGNYTFKCKIGKHEIPITVIPLGDLNISKKLGFNVLQYELEDLILDLAFEDNFYNHVLTQAIEFYKEKKGKDPSQKALVKILESTCDNPDYGIYKLISNLFKNKNIKNILPNHIFESFNEFIH